MDEGTARSNLVAIGSLPQIAHWGEGVMLESFARFAEIVKSTAPRAAIVLGSGLADSTRDVVELSSLAYGAIPGLVPTTVHGHRGRLVLGDWSGVPVLVAFGRLHYYEGHSPEVVTALVREVAKLGVPRLILTNAAGGIHDSLRPGSLMAIRGHVKLIGPQAWRNLAAGVPFEAPYSTRLLRHMLDFETAAGRELLAGLYVAQTGPAYESIAEVRALKALGIDAAGMSTAMEAETGADAGMEVAAISCITNKAAGLGDGPLDHQEVLVNAKLAVERLGLLIHEMVHRI